MCDIIVTYFIKISKENIKNNSVLICKFLGKMLDFGYLRNLEALHPHTFITQQSMKSYHGGQTQITSEAITHISRWREGIKYP